MNIVLLECLIVLPVPETRARRHASPGGRGVERRWRGGPECGRLCGEADASPVGRQRNARQADAPHDDRETAPEADLPPGPAGLDSALGAAILRINAGLDLDTEVVESALAITGDLPESLRVADLSVHVRALGIDSGCDMTPHAGARTVLTSHAACVTFRASSVTV